MKKTILAATAISVASVSSAFAADAIVPPAPIAEGATASTQAASVETEETIVRGQYRTRAVRSSNKAGFFQRWAEFERRKNAYLRARFLGR